MKYKITQEPSLNGNAFEVVTKGEDGQSLRHTFTMTELELEDNGKPKWLNYIDDFYLKKYANEGRFDFRAFKDLKYVERDLLKDHFEKEGKEFKVDHKKVLDIVKKVQATPTKSDDIDLLEDLKWVGPEIAESLVVKFGDLSGVLNASRSDLIDVNGIGEGNVDKIMEQINQLKEK